MAQQKKADGTKVLKREDYRLLADFRHVVREFLAFSEERATEIGLAPQQHQALLAIKGFESGAPTIGDLARRLVIKHNSAVGLVDRLVQSDLVVRKVDGADRRRAILALTEEGERLLARLSATHRAELRRVAPMLRELLRQLSE